MEKLTLDNIINLLEKQGIGSKQIVLKMLKNATEENLEELRNSINNPKKIIFENHQFRCPSCSSSIDILDILDNQKYCHYCGQRLEWQE